MRIGNLDNLIGKKVLFSMHSLLPNFSTLRKTLPNIYIEGILYKKRDIYFIKNTHSYYPEGTAPEWLESVDDLLVTKNIEATLVPSDTELADFLKKSV